uniref:Uncharacterized protein n=1 Tax=Guillardia theta TaxID=55529 RepID=A0A7S4KZ21_GUITH|mmetsp:Transcript_33803/g.106048  ORF Transcript_33803/g.106048 Transcript_33803/m.106048 type:complete len:104 (+) Transcript_33803:549-860(+)
MFPLRLCPLAFNFGYLSSESGHEDSARSDFVGSFIRLQVKDGGLALEISVVLLRLTLVVQKDFFSLPTMSSPAVSSFYQLLSSNSSPSDQPCNYFYRFLPWTL